MDEKFKINRDDLRDEKFLKFIENYNEEMEHFTKIIMLIEPDTMFIKSNMKKLLYFVYKKNQEKELK